MKRLVPIIILLLSSAVLAQVNELDSYNESPSRLRGAIEKFREDSDLLDRFYTAETSPNREARYRKLYDEWLAMLASQNF
ncbi:MAG TPA: hypothetical protein PKM58_04050, partial [Pyrinomonadaceae bacterium]|nr:hypothetical protein [Pyrinomonadaceae bacterium]